MQIWVDADACPNAIKEIIFRAADRRKISTLFVANQSFRTPASPYIRKILVPAGFDVADQYIVNHMNEGDLVITADIPLAHLVVNQGGTALNPRGELYSKNNIKERLSLRDFGEGLRNAGIATRGPAKLSQKEIRDFANGLDQFLTNLMDNLS